MGLIPLPASEIYAIALTILRLGADCWTTTRGKAARQIDGNARGQQWQSVHSSAKCSSLESAPAKFFAAR
ncbi:MAG TPA: hypothetical protein DD416_12350, partial [Rhodobacteraceae bacterium]|nr:hypothetical protein [Paracoccaceae bacterium]